MPKTIEKMIRFPVNGRAVAATLHLPPGAGRPGVLMLHGLKSNRCGRKFVRVSRLLAERGVASLRIDFRGSGESEGAFEDATIRTAVEDARAALTALAGVRGVSSRMLAVLGASMGGVAAARLAALDRRVKAAVLWATPMDFKARIDALLATPEAAEQIRRTGWYAMGAYRFGPAFLGDAKAVDTASDVRRTRAHLLFIQGDADQTVPPRDARALMDVAARRRTAGLTQALVTLSGAGHGFESVEAEDAAVGKTVDWLAEKLAAVRGGRQG
jgi:uncharacterized protein